MDIWTGPQWSCYPGYQNKSPLLSLRRKKGSYLKMLMGTYNWWSSALFFYILETKQVEYLWCPLTMLSLFESCFLLLSSFHLVSFSWYCFHFSVCQGFPLHVFDFSIPFPQGSLLSQLTDICQWRNITTIADVEMLIPSPLGPDYRRSRFAAHPRCF